MKHGVMKLISGQDEILRTRQYWGIQHRKDIIEYWGKFYGKRFKDLSIHLTPAINSNGEAVKKNGKNMRFKKDISLAKKGIAEMAASKNLPVHKINDKDTSNPFTNKWRKAGGATNFKSKTYL